MRTLKVFPNDKLKNYCTVMLRSWDLTHISCAGADLYPPTKRRHLQQKTGFTSVDDAAALSLSPPPEGEDVLEENKWLEHFSQEVRVMLLLLLSKRSRRRLAADQQSNSAVHGRPSLPLGYLEQPPSSLQDFG